MLFPPLICVTLYVALCWVMGFVGRHTKFGFWGNFWVSVAFTPIIGIIVLLAQDSRPPKTTTPNPVQR